MGPAKAGHYDRHLPNNPSSIAIEYLDGDVARTRKRMREAIRPLDRQHSQV